MSIRKTWRVYLKMGLESHWNQSLIGHLILPQVDPIRNSFEDGRDVDEETDQMSKSVYS
jgi:hypothetical protein